MNCKYNLIDNSDGIKLIAVATYFSSVLAEKLSVDDQNVIGNFLLGVGQNLLIIAAQNSKNANCSENNK